MSDVKERWCKKEKNYHQSVWTKDPNAQDDVYDFVLPLLEQGFDVKKFPHDITTQLQLLGDYFFSSYKVANLTRLLFGYTCYKKLQPKIGQLYMNSVPPVEIAKRLMHAALLCFHESIPEDVFVSIIAYYVNTRKDQRWCERVLFLCHHNVDLTFKLWFTEEMWMYIDTYLFSKWWHFYGYDL